MSDAESPSLIGYAILKARYDGEGKTYIDNFEQFVLSVVDQYDGKPMTVKVAAEKVKKNFGIEIPVEVVKRIGRHADRNGRLRRDSEGRFIGLTPQGKSGLPDLNGEISKYRRAEAVLEQGLRECVKQMCKSDTDLLEVDWKCELKKYIESQSVDIIRHWRGVDVRTVSDDDVLRLTRDERIRYVISEYVKSMYLSATESFQALVSLAQGAMLSTLLEGQSWDEVPKIDNLSVALDTSIVLDLLNLQGSERHIAAEDVLNMIRVNGVDCFVFQNTLSEIDSILNNVECVLRGEFEPSRLDGVLEYAYKHSLKPSDIAICRDKVEGALEKMSVNIKGNPPYEHIYCLDEEKLEYAIHSYVFHKNPLALNHDVAALSAIHRMRRGRAGAKMENARYLFVTANTAVVRGCRQFADDERYSYPLAISFEYLATRLWLRAPLASENVPKDLLVASAYAGLRPNQRVWDEVLKNIEQARRENVIGDEEARILRLRTESGELYMRQLAAGEEIDGNVFVLEALEQFKDEVKAPLKSENNAIANQLLQQSEHSARTISSMQEKLRERERSIGELRSQEDVLKLENQKLADEIKSLREKSCEVEEAVRLRNIRLLATVLQVLFVMAILIIVAMILFWFRDQFPNLKSFVWGSITGLGGMVFSILCAVLQRQRFVSCAEWLLSKRQ